MYLFNGFDMTDFDAYDADYSYCKTAKADIEFYRVRKRNRMISNNAERGIWFTGIKLKDIEHYL